jgi:hypothetical protein
MEGVDWRLLGGIGARLVLADDVVGLVWVLRTAARRAGPAALRRHWPGTPDGPAALERLVGTVRRDR